MMILSFINLITVTIVFFHSALSKAEAYSDLNYKPSPHGISCRFGRVRGLRAHIVQITLAPLPDVSRWCNVEFIQHIAQYCEARDPGGERPLTYRVGTTIKREDRDTSWLLKGTNTSTLVPALHSQ